MRIEFRDAVVERLHNAFKDRKDCRLQHENGAEVDMDSFTLPVVAYQIVYRNSEQADLSAKPRIKDEGNILITVMVKALTGSRKAYAIRDDVARLLERSEVGGAVTQVARMLPDTPVLKGWVGYRCAVPFWHYHF